MRTLQGYMGRYLRIDLSSGKIAVEPLDEVLRQMYLGGYGVGVRILYEEMAPKEDPLGEGNILAFFTGPLTGTPALIGSRYAVMAKSPKSGGWGDANSGGYFGPSLKFAGFDGVVFRGKAPSPVYLVVQDGRAELRDAKALWGKNVYETEAGIAAKHGAGVHTVSIGIAGEERSYLAAIMSDGGRAAARSGLGAVMGSKRLKAVAVQGSMDVPIADRNRLLKLRSAYIAAASEQRFYRGLQEYGTCADTARKILVGDAPVRNWAGAGSVEFAAEKAEGLSGSSVTAFQKRRWACYQCPIACGGILSVKRAELRPVPQTTDSHKPEYETLAMLGSNLLNDNVEAVIDVNNICNDYGLDTISLGATLAFAIESFERGLISEEETDGIHLRWGDAEQLVTLAEMTAGRKGFGAILADGIEQAVAQLGIDDEYGMHVGGEEVPAHDPRLTPDLATTYLLNATPARHTQGSELHQPPGLVLPLDRAKAHSKLANLAHVVNAAGLCLFGYLAFDIDSLPAQIGAVTGLEASLDDLDVIGMRIETMRHMYNLREGHNPLNRSFPNRLAGIPPLEKGPLSGRTVDYMRNAREYLRLIGWDTSTAIPSDKSVRDLGLDFLIGDLQQLRATSSPAAFSDR